MANLFSCITKNDDPRSEVISIINNIELQSSNLNSYKKDLQTE